MKLWVASQHETGHGEPEGREWKQREEPEESDGRREVVSGVGLVALRTSFEVASTGCPRRMGGELVVTI